MSSVKHRVSAASAVFLGVVAACLYPSLALAVEPNSLTVQREAPAGTVAVWIDVEQAGLTPKSVAVTFSQTGQTVLDMRQTQFGLAVVAVAKPGDATVEFTALEDVDAHFSVVYVDDKGIVLDGWDTHAVLKALSRGPSGSPSSSGTPSPSGTPTSSGTQSSSARPSPPTFPAGVGLTSLASAAPTTANLSDISARAGGAVDSSQAAAASGLAGVIMVTGGLALFAWRRHGVEGARR